MTAHPAPPASAAAALAEPALAEPALPERALAEREIAAGALLLRHALPPGRLRKTVYRALLDGRAVVLWPTRESAPTPQQRADFVAGVAAAELYFPGAQVAVPAGDYGGDCLYVVHPARAPLTLDTCPPGDDYRYRRKLLAAGRVQGLPVDGLTLQQIAEIERLQGVTLPREYAAFLRECGRAAGTLCSDCDFFYPGLRHLKRHALEMLEDARQEAQDHYNFHDFHLPDQAFVLSAYQGHQFHYCLCDGDDDPPVYACLVGTAPTLVWPSCSAYLENLIHGP